MKWSYDEKDGRYYVEGARISFTNFTGTENDYNRAGRKNFKLRLDEALYNELIDRNVRASMREPREEGDEAMYSVKVGVYPNTDVYLLTRKAKNLLDYDNLDMVDHSVSRGQVENGQIDLSFHVSVNTQMAKPTYYLRCDEIYIPLKESRFDRKYENYGMEDDEPFDE